jgi:hypothetical protein
MEESLAFLKAVIEPIDPEQQAELNVAMDNPELADVVDLLTILLDQEQDNMFEIVGKVRFLVTQVQKVLPQKPKAKKAAGRGARSPAPST